MGCIHCCAADCSGNEPCILEYEAKTIEKIKNEKSFKGLISKALEGFFCLPVDKTVLSVYTVYIQIRGDMVHIFIDNKSGAPIYDQIYTQIKNQIISGELEENQPLPSIRNLAKDLRVSVITTKRAYDELEREGFIYTLPAKGCFIAPKNVELLKEETLKKIEQHIQEIMQLGAVCNLTKEELLEMVRVNLEELP